MDLSRVVSQIFNVEMKSSKVVPFDRLDMVSYQCSIVTLSLRDIRLQKCRDLENRVRGPSMSPCLSRTVAKIDGDFSRKLQKLPFPLYFAPLPPLKGFPLELGIGAGWSENQNDGATGPTEKFDDIFNRLDTMHQRDRQVDGQTDGQTSGDSKDRAYAQRRVVKITEQYFKTVTKLCGAIHNIEKNIGQSVCKTRKCIWFTVAEPVAKLLSHSIS